MIVTWTVLRTPAPVAVAPWTPVGAAWWQAGRSSAGRAQPPGTDGLWWSVLAGWDDAHGAAAEPLTADGVEVWHVVLEPVSCHGDVVLADGTRPFDALTGSRPVEGAAALITVAGDSADDAREREFFRRFLHVSRDIAGARGHLVSLVHAPVEGAGAGPVLTFSVWEGLSAGIDWAYSSSRPHAGAVRRQHAHQLVQASGSVRCAVLSSTGTLGGAGDPLARRGASAG